MIEKLLEMAFLEDLGGLGDITSNAIFTHNKLFDTCYLIAKQDGVLCGKDIFAYSFQYIDNDCKVKFSLSDNDKPLLDGDLLKCGQQIAEVQGSINTILKAERVAINFISHLSGISTEVRKWIDELSLIPNNKTKILDTRKTLPGWRQLQKYAVKCGGGTNHRMGLYDMVMIKDNHIDSAGGITKSVQMVRKKWGGQFKIEVETRNLEEVEEALINNVDIIMLDNMDIDSMKEAVKLINGKTGGRIKTEASGNMNLERVKLVAETGVDYISVGALTHSVKAFDFSLRKILK